MKRLIIAAPIMGLLISGAVPSLACLWDADTIAMERARFPGIEKIIVGKFPRHSKEFYEWRKKHSEEVLKRDPKQASAYDNLAVAQHKLGDHRGAIATMEAKERVLPGIYETYSNRGTFHIYTGELAEAVKWIEQALKINPNAHFGREKYQLWLVQWLQAGKPQDDGEDPPQTELGLRGFAGFVAKKAGHAGGGGTWGKGRLEALGGIAGMMRFADFDNPVLAEVLGDVLWAGEMKDNAAILAALSYASASRHAVAPDEKKRLLKKARTAASMVPDLKPDAIDRELDAALAEGVKYNEQVRQDEIAWIKAGRDAAAEFDVKYLKTSK